MLKDLPLAFRFASREMRGGLRGFLIFLTSIAFGAAAIGGVNSVARAITAGVASEGQALLGGDIRFQLIQREATDKEKTFLESVGTVSHNAGMRSMARMEDGSDQSRVEAKAVDDAYPLYGQLVTGPALPRAELFAERSGVFGAAAPDLLFERLNLKLGDRIKLGSTTFELRAKLLTEPDAVSDGFGFAPRLLVSMGGAECLRADPARQSRRACLQGAHAGRRQRSRGGGRSRARECRVPRGRLERPDKDQCCACAVGQHRALHTIPDAGRPDLAGGRRR